MAPPGRLAGAGRLAVDLARDRGIRRAWWLRVRQPHNLFQPGNDTGSDRYPELFALLRARLGDGPGVRLLSFGCSTGEEVFTLRRYFAEARLTGIDISRGNIAECRRRQRRSGDDRMAFVRAGTAEHEPVDTYDAVLAMAVFRHGDLGNGPPASCADRITFEAFDATVARLADSLRVGGLLVIEHSNFRFCDTRVSERFAVVATRDRPSADRPNPLYGPDDRLLADQEYREVVFVKIR